MSAPSDFFMLNGFYWGNDGSGPYVVNGTGDYQLSGYMFSLISGELQQFNRLAIFNGGPGVTISATGVVRDTSVGVYRLRCLTAGTIKLWDNATAASGPVLVDTTAMAAGAVIEIGELATAGVYATVTSGTYKLVVTA